MTIIEGVAKLLGPIEQPNSKSSALAEKGGILELDPIERAVSESNERSEFHAARELTAQLETKAIPARPTSRTTRTLRVDLDRLRKQGIITPNGERTPIAESFRR